MTRDFGNLIEQFGVPKIIVPNTPKMLRDARNGTLVWTNPKDTVGARDKIYYRRFGLGETDFLAVKSRIETWLSREKALLEYLQEQNLKPVEIIYRYKGARAWDYSTQNWKEAKVAVAADADVEPLSREDLLKAVEEKRVVWVAGWSSMGDAYVDFCLGSPDKLPNDAGYHFLFEPPCRLSSEMLAGLGEGYERDEEFFNYHSDYFSRPFLMDK